ncbi:MAG: PDZ domain-containing protein [Chlamydiales bacterium]|nr:PDZ domain-containing protein [Chlamydiales bacterium]
MRLRFLLILLLCSSLYSQETLLTGKDVQSVMNQFFELHVDKKEISSQLLERSLNIYLNQFDPSHAYLLNEEALPYVHPKQDLLRTMQREYQQHRFSTYFSLNKTVQNSIQRARQWRVKWEQNPHKVVEDAREVEINARPEKSYAKNLQELQERHYDRFIRFVAFQMDELGCGTCEGKERLLVELCEKQIRILENEYLGLDDHGRPLAQQRQEHQVILRTLKALAQSLDAHTAYYSPEEAYAMKVQLEKGMCGIGVVLREGVDGITVRELIKGGPAEKSGRIQEGDAIVAVDGEEIRHASFHKVLELMRGKEGTRTVLGIMRKTDRDPQFLTVELIRKKIVLDDKRVDVEAEPYGDGVIGKITLHSFYEGEDGLSSEKDIKNAIDQLRAQGPLYGLVLDMRENGGGFLSQAVKVSGLFISSGVVVISKYSDGSVKYYRTLDGERYYEGPLVLLLSRGSASATEIVAQTLKDYGVAVIVGDEQTYGKGTIQHQTVTNDRTDSFFKVTVGRYYTVSGKSTQIEGVKADIIVPSEFQFQEIGEVFLDYPLPSDQVPSAYQDTLSDIDPFARRWFQRYYTPTLQRLENKWNAMIPRLKANSEKRIAQNRNFQEFLKEIKAELKPKEELHVGGSNDLQMDESVNIVKDMIFLSNSSALTP